MTPCFHAAYDLGKDDRQREGVQDPMVSAKGALGGAEGSGKPSRGDVTKAGRKSCEIARSQLCYASRFAHLLSRSSPLMSLSLDFIVHRMGTIIIPVL